MSWTCIYSIPSFPVRRSTAAETLDGSAGTRWDERLDVFLNHSHVSRMLLIDLVIPGNVYLLRIVSPPKQSKTNQIDSHLFLKSPCKMCGLQMSRFTFKKNRYKLPSTRVPDVTGKPVSWEMWCFFVFSQPNNKRLQDTQRENESSNKTGKSLSKRYDEILKYDELQLKPSNHSVTPIPLTIYLCPCSPPHTSRWRQSPPKPRWSDGQAIFAWNKRTAELQKHPLFVIPTKSRRNET